MADTPVTNKTMLLTFIGKNEHGDHKYISDISGNTMYFKKALFSGRPGTIYSVQYTDKNNTLAVLNLHQEYKGIHPDKTEVAEWQMQHDAAKECIRTKNKIKKETGINIWKEQLKPLQEAYFRASPAEKSALLLLVMQFIMKRS